MLSLSHVTEFARSLEHKIIAFNASISRFPMPASIVKILQKKRCPYALERLAGQFQTWINAEHLTSANDTSDLHDLVRYLSPRRPSPRETCQKPYSVPVLT